MTKPLAEMTTSELITTIHQHYSGRMHTLDFNDVETRALLALHLGMLIGTCARLLRELEDARRRS